MIDRLQIEGVGMTSRRTRARLVDRLRRHGIRDERVLQAMMEVPRHLFVDEALASRAYEDTPLPIGHGQTISQPWVVARMTELLLQAGEVNRVLEVGTGCGYQTAVLSVLVNQVWSVERIGALLEQARERFRLLRLANVHLRHGDGYAGWPEEAPFDAILVAAAPEEVPPALLEQLRVGGRLVIPVGAQGGQQLMVYDRTAKGVSATTCDYVSFVPLIGGTR